MPDIAELLERLGVEYAPAGLDEALTHSTYSYENGGRDQRRMAFLGDPVVRGAVVTSLVTALPDTTTEKVLARRTDWAVRAPTLAQTAQELHLDEFIRTGAGAANDRLRTSNPTLATAYQAVIGAIHADPRLDAVAAVERTHGWAIAQAIATDMGAPWKNQLTAWSRFARAGDPEYRATHAGPDHRRRWYVEALVGGDVVGEAGSRSKKDAETTAAAKGVQAFQRGYGAEAPPTLAPANATTKGKRKH